MSLLLRRLTAQSQIDVAFIAATTTLYAPTLAASGAAPLNVPFVSSATAVYAPTLAGTGAAPLGSPFITSSTVLYDLTLAPAGAATLQLPFIPPVTVVFAPTIQQFEQPPAVTGGWHRPLVPFVIDEETLDEELDEEEAAVLAFLLETV